MVKRKRRKAKKNIGVNLKLIVYILLLLLLISLVGLSLFNILSINIVDPALENTSRHKILSQLGDDLESTLFVLEREKGEQRKISDVYVFLNNSKKGESLLIYVPGSLYFSGLEENFGSPIAISSLRYAGDFLQEGRGIEYTVWQISEILGFKMDNYIWITTEAYEVFWDVYGDLNEIKEKYKEGYIKDKDETLADSFFKLHTISSKYSVLKTLLNSRRVSTLDGNMYSNMSFLSVLGRVDRFESVVARSLTNSIDMGSAKYSEGELSERGGQIRSINIAEYDKAFRQYMFKMLPREQERERVRVEVYNASGRAGRASIYARKILNNGCDVVRFGNAPDNIEKTQVYVSDMDEFENSFNVVSEILLGKFEIVEERPSFMTTGDIVILLGEDISQIEIF
jgi:hypothetical protein